VCGVLLEALLMAPEVYRVVGPAEGRALVRRSAPGWSD
jgi:hypothetical protein